MNKWVLVQFKSEASLEVNKNNKTETVLLLVHHKKAGFFLEKTTMLGKIEDNRKRETTNLRWVDSIKETIGLSLQELSRAIEDSTLKTWLIHRFNRSHS